VQQVFRSDATEFTYDRLEQPLRRIGPWRDKFDRMLAAKAHKPKFDRLTNVRTFEELRALGKEGG
jgi:hypothetical protein